MSNSHDLVVYGRHRRNSDRSLKVEGFRIVPGEPNCKADVPTVANLAKAQKEGDRSVERPVEHYDLDMVLSVGYRGKSPEGVT